MRHINEYMKSDSVYIQNIFEGQETSSNAERKAELEKYLKGKKYKDYVDTLNKMLEDPKAKTLLEDGFGGELGDTKLSFKVVNIPVKNLRPTQAEIDVSKSIDFPLSIAPGPNIKNYFENAKKGVMINEMPLITFRGNYIIDGHHRWSQLYAFVPDAKMVCCNYDGDISPIQMLKATQGAIAAVKADDDNHNDGKIPSEKVEGQDLFSDKWNDEAIVKYVEEKAKDEAVDVIHKYVDSINDKKQLGEYIAENLMSLKSNNYPESDAPSRGDMPQTDQGGEDAKNKKTSLPGAKGSALNKLKDDKFVKDAVK